MGLIGHLSPGEEAAVLEAHSAERSELRSQANRDWRTTSGKGLPAPGNTPVNGLGSFSFSSPPSCPTVAGIRGGVGCDLVSLRPPGLLLLCTLVDRVALLLALFLLLLLEFAMMSSLQRRRSSWLQSPRANSPRGCTPDGVARGPEALPLDG